MAPYMDQARDQTGHRARRRRCKQGQHRRIAVDSHQRGDGRAQREGAVHRQIREVQDAVGDQQAQGQNAINKALLQRAGDNVQNRGKVHCFNQLSALAQFQSNMGEARPLKEEGRAGQGRIRGYSAVTEMARSASSAGTVRPYSARTSSLI